MSYIERAFTPNLDVEIIDAVGKSRHRGDLKVPFALGFLNNREVETCFFRNMSADDLLSGKGVKYVRAAVSASAVFHDSTVPPPSLSQIFRQSHFEHFCRVGEGDDETSLEKYKELQDEYISAILGDRLEFDYGWADWKEACEYLLTRDDLNPQQRSDIEILSVYNNITRGIFLKWREEYMERSIKERRLYPGMNTTYTHIDGRRVNSRFNAVLVLLGKIKPQ